MPPLLPPSDDESVGESIPFNDIDDAPAKEDSGSEGSGSDDEEEEEEYVVEQILSHDFAKDGTVLLQVKWMGYDDETMEPEENLEGAKQLLKNYYKSIGGRPEKPTKKRKSMGSTATSTPDKPPAKRGRKSKQKQESPVNGTPEAAEGYLPDWVPKTKSWENQVQGVDTISRDPTTQTLYAYLAWNNGKKSKVSVERCYEKCPMMMLKFYEQHLVFKDG